TREGALARARPRLADRPRAGAGPRPSVGLAGLQLRGAEPVTHLDAPRAGLGGLGHGEGQHALVDAGLDGVGVDPGRDGDGALELAARDAARPVAAALGLLALLAVGQHAVDGQLTALEADVELLGPQARDRHLEHDGV